jgi:hypothetical protein
MNDPDAERRQALARSRCGLNTAHDDSSGLTHAVALRR